MQRIYPSSAKVKCKLSVIAEATSDRIEALPYAATQPYEDHFYPGRVQGGNGARRRVGNPYRTVSLVPLETQVDVPCSGFHLLILVGDWEGPNREMGLLCATSLH